VFQFERRQRIGGGTWNDYITKISALRRYIDAGAVAVKRLQQSILVRRWREQFHIFVIAIISILYIAFAVVRSVHDCALVHLSLPQYLTLHAPILEIELCHSFVEIGTLHDVPSAEKERNRMEGEWRERIKVSYLRRMFV
jgi:hypothetical protein